MKLMQSKFCNAHLFFTGVPGVGWENMSVKTDTEVFAFYTTFMQLFPTHLKLVHSVFQSFVWTISFSKVQQRFPHNKIYCLYWNKEIEDPFTHCVLRIVLME